MADVGIDIDTSDVMKATADIKRVGDTFEKTADQIVSGSNRVNNAASNATRTVNQFGEVTRIAGNKVNTLGMTFQGIGYQVADFAVQVQSGTNAIVAFGQQASQVAGYFGPWGAAVGAVLAIGSAFAFSAYQLNNTSKKAEELNYNLKDFENVGTIFESVGADLENGLGGAIDRVREKYGDLIADITERRAMSMVDQLKGAMGSTDVATAPGIMGGLGQVGSDIFRNSFGMFGLSTGDNAPELMEQIRVAEEVSAIVEELAGLTVPQVAESWGEVFQRIQEVDGITEQQINQIYAVADALGVIDEIERQRIDNIEQVNRLENNVLKSFQEGVQYLNEQSSELNQQLTMMEVQRQYGETSLQALVTRQIYERAAREEEAIKAGIAGEALQTLLSQVDAVHEFEIRVHNANAAGEALRETLGDAAYNAMMLAGTDIVSGISSAAARAYDLAAGLGAALSNASSLAALGSISGGISSFTGGLSGMLGAASDFYYGRPTGEFSGPAPRSRPHSFIDAGVPAPSRGGGSSGSGSGSGGGTPEETAEDILQDIEAELEQRRRLLGLNEEQRDLTEKIIDIEEKLGDKRQDVTDDRIRQLAEEQYQVEQLLEAQQDAERAREQMIDNIESSFNDAVLSFVDGTESINDAFRGMLRQMLLDIYEQQVLEKYTDYASNFLGAMFSANGNVFGPSGHISYFAKGDVFNSPTAFSFGGGKLGVMGEAGPEAVMPLKRGSDGKLGVAVQGSQGNVTVVQNFNLSANGDESVKRIVRQEAPRLAQHAKSAVLEEVQRGGTYAKAIRGR